MEWIYSKFVELLNYKRHAVKFQIIREPIERFTHKVFGGKTCLKKINIQIMRGCNYICWFCAQRSRYIEHKAMPTEVFMKIIERLKEIDFDGIIHTYSYDEPFLNPNAAEMIDCLAKEFPKSEIQVSTNGALLNETDCFRLLRRPNMYIFINTYARQNIIGKVKDWPEHDRLRICYRNKPYGLFNWAGCLETDYKLPLKLDCMRPNVEFQITIDGDVMMCGLDFNVVNVAGNIMKDSIPMIWNNPRWRQLREDLRNNKRTGLCASCDYNGLVNYVNKRYTGKNGQK